ncbi:MAG: short-chain dehydrogenase [Gemmatimonadota bacterium]|nr:MAG: short-chain dehydrogenase [Gemmatimonadota bacterium]
MELNNKTVLILGGSGLVGRAVARRLLSFGPAKIVLVALYESEVSEALEALSPVAGDTEIKTAWGNIFLPSDAARVDRDAMLESERLRNLVIGDLLGDLSGDVLQRSFLYQLFQRYKPDAVIDCINTATAYAYQDIFHSARQLLDSAHSGKITARQVEEHVLTLTMPQLIRHIQIMVESLRVAGAEAYVKVGTSGTGGMGLNIPYTHSEERPSRTLLNKSAVAGAHSLLLFLVGRTPGEPATVEIKPTTAIAWRDIAFGAIGHHAEPIKKYDCPDPLPVSSAFKADASGWTNTGADLKAVYVNTGENGLFSRDEFETVTALGQMEFITPEEVAEYVTMELQGRPTGKDIIAALDSATAGPTYRAGILRAAAIERMKELEKEHGVRAVAFEMLGPPRLSKILYEAYILSQLKGSIRELAESSADEVSGNAVRLVTEDGDLRSRIISVGLPIILPEDRVFRGAHVVVPFQESEDLNKTVGRGWVDLRPECCNVWIERANRILEQDRTRADGTGSDVDWGALGPDDEIQPSRLAAWIFSYEDGGERIKR